MAVTDIGEHSDWSAGTGRDLSYDNCVENTEIVSDHAHTAYLRKL